MLKQVSKTEKILVVSLVALPMFGVGVHSYFKESKLLGVMVIASSLTALVLTLWPYPENPAQKAIRRKLLYLRDLARNDRTVWIFVAITGVVNVKLSLDGHSRSRAIFGALLVIQALYFAYRPKRKKQPDESGEPAQ